jgi:hypothetical protein
MYGFDSVELVGYEKLWGKLAIASAFGEAGLFSSDSPVIARCFTKQKAQPCGLG